MASHAMVPGGVAACPAARGVRLSRQSTAGGARSHSQAGTPPGRATHRALSACVPRSTRAQGGRVISGAARPRGPVGRPHWRRAETAVTASAASPVAAAAAPAPAVGAKLVPAVISVAVGLAVRFLVPCPAGVTLQAWSLLAIFLSTITGLVLEPLPVGAWAFLGLTTAVATKTLTFQAAFGAFTNDVIWLIVISFFFAKGFVKTGLGDRVANFFVAVLGRSTLGLSYGLVLSETLIAPAMPSTTARAGGVFLPIILSLAKQAGSLPGQTARRMGAFLIQAQLQCAAHSSALFLTAAAQNLLALKLAAEVTGVALPNPWVTWFTAALLPAVVALIATPYVVFKLLPPDVTTTPDAPAAAKDRLQAMGPPTRDERIMVATMGLAVLLWVCGDAIGVSSVLAAMIALCALLLGGVLQWADCLGEKSAWDTLTWFAVLVGMSGQLNALGLVAHVSTAIGGALTALHLTWPAVCILMNVAYFALHYIFASQTAHVGALLSACLAVMLTAGVPPVLGTLTLAYTTNLFGAITHYSSGQAAVYYGAGYTDLPTTFRMGAICAALNLAIWGVVGGAWWKVLGLF